MTRQAGFRVSVCGFGVLGITADVALELASSSLHPGFTGPIVLAVF